MYSHPVQGEERRKSCHDSALDQHPSKTRICECLWGCSLFPRGLGTFWPGMFWNDHPHDPLLSMTFVGAKHKYRQPHKCWEQSCLLPRGKYGSSPLPGWLWLLVVGSDCWFTVHLGGLLRLFCRKKCVLYYTLCQLVRRTVNTEGKRPNESATLS